MRDWLRTRYILCILISFSPHLFIFRFILISFRLTIIFVIYAFSFSLFSEDTYHIDRVGFTEYIS